ncbi:flagellar biosynthetic protein FliO [Pelagerythrobacter marensis]|uniref:Uncharacterized protein n=1 Tax=Pelagerythrobacter marensis TaxID=543877 RepID=A0A0G3X8S7_9SPHN|nr:flagellar biosynthetic protein FliO [Pelagerythrobacter marensis]AKM07975.1 hypothetical protein AM2010_1913 [Pelagerythrobacter marensis]
MRTLAAILTGFLAEPARAAARLAGGSSPDIPWLRLVLSFAVCIVVAFGVIVALRKFQRTTRGNRFARMLGRDSARVKPTIRLLEMRQIGMHADLCLIEFDNQQLLLAATAHRVEVLEKRAVPCATKVGDDA